MLSSTVDLCLKSIYEVYFEPLAKPLSRSLRLLYSFLGSLVFHFWYYFIEIRRGSDQDKDLKILSVDDLSVDEPISIELTSLYFSLSSIQGQFIFFFIILVLSAVYANVIAFGYTKHGPIRYFIGSALLSTFMLFLAHSVVVDNVYMNGNEN